MAAASPVPLAAWADAPGPEHLYINASAVAVDGRGVMICGAPGAGKSTLALELMTLGANLIADDGIRVDLGDGPGTRPFLQRPDTATDLIESRGRRAVARGAPFVGGRLCRWSSIWTGPSPTACRRDGTSRPEPPRYR